MSGLFCIHSIRYDRSQPSVYRVQSWGQQGGSRTEPITRRHLPRPGSGGPAGTVASLWKRHIPSFVQRRVAEPFSRRTPWPRTSRFSSPASFFCRSSRLAAEMSFVSTWGLSVVATWNSRNRFIRMPFQQGALYGFCYSHAFNSAYIL